jgi:hypothetical protein
LGTGIGGVIIAGDRRLCRAPTLLAVLVALAMSVVVLLVIGLRHLADRGRSARAPPSGDPCGSPAEG